MISRPELKDESSTSTISSNSSNLQRATQLVRWAANIVTYQLSPAVGRTLSLKSHHQQSAATGHMIIDSGTNVSVMGCTWAVVEDTGRRCEMSGFANDLVKSDIPMCSGKTVVKVDTQKVLLGFHKAPYLKHNKHGLLSTGQACKYGTCVDNTLRRHGGGHRIAGQDNHGTSYNFELDVTDGLLTLQTRYPTQDERESLPTVWLTSAKPWDPTSLEAPDKQVLPSTDRTSDDTVGAVSLSTKGKTQPPNYNKFRERLGWLPLDTIRKTFKATTQLAGTLPLRLPLCRHIKSRFPQLNQRRLAKTFATDTLFSSTPGLGGITCAQLFVGKSSHFTSVYGMRTESEGPPLSKTSSESMASHTYSVTTTRRCKLVRPGMTSSVNTASRPNF